MKKTIFKGRYSHALDDKGRIRIPTKLKDLVGGSAFFTYGNGCILMMTAEQGDDLLEKFSEKSDILKIESTDLVRKISQGDVYEEDGQGRILLPTHMLEYAGLKKNVVSVGMINWVEIWDEETLNKKESKVSFEEAVLSVRKLETDATASTQG
ncbi:MAG: hypothetical protein FWD86_02200 [Firmicutes bacterium]|nr:hypothetical protein [Bacillota bacterium]